jgi:hypothetical protein
MAANAKRHKALSATAKMKNMSYNIVTFLDDRIGELCQGTRT